MKRTREELLDRCQSIRDAEAEALESNNWTLLGIAIKAHATVVARELERRLLAEGEWSTDFAPLVNRTCQVWVAYGHGAVCSEEASVAWSQRGVTDPRWKQIAWRHRDPAPEFPSHLLAPADSQRVAEGLVEP